jgi:hypothetical protein
MNSDGTGATELTSMPLAEPQWSHGAGEIAFSARPCGTSSCPQQIYVMHADGSGITQLTTGATSSFAPRWSPDGARILFARGLELRIMNADGSEQKLVQSPVYGAGDWSPDGTRIVFASDRRLPANWWNNFQPYDLYTVHPDGQGLVRILTVAPTGTGNPCDTYPDLAYEPRWSPDGQHIAFLMRGDPYCIFDEENVPPLGIAVVAPDGSGYRSLVPSAWSDFEVEGPPIWSPDSAHITYAASGATFVAHLDGSPATLVTGYPPPGDWQPLPVNTPSSFARPRGATPMYVSLVPAFDACSAPNATHGAPLSFGSCAPPGRSSSRLTVGAPDANGRRADSQGFLQINAQVGTAGAPDDADARIVLQLTSVYEAADFSDYTGELEARLPVQLTDKQSGVASTVIGLPLSFAVPCAATSDPNAGATCTTSTTADAIRPGFAQEGQRSNWELGKVEVFDGGEDGVASTTGDNELFAVQGVFVP